MTEWLTSMGPGVGNHLWQSTGFAALAWVVTLLLRRNQARVRYGVWVAASVKFLVPFSLLIGLGGMLPRPRRPVVAMPVYSAVDEVGMPFDADVLPTGTVAATHISESRSFGWLRTAADWSVILAGVWGCGVLVVLVVWCAVCLRVARTLRRARRVEAGREAEILRRLEAAMGGRRRPVTLMLSRELMEPGMFGIWRLVLIWPERLSERLDDEHIEAVMIHEIAHARRKDNLTAAVHMVVEAAFWFHPMVWWMERRMVEERERACDEAVVEMGSRPVVYAESLLKACRFCVESPLVCVAGITGADLAARVRAIMTLRAETLGWWRKAALGALGLAAIAGPVAFGVVRMIPMYGQMVHATGPLPTFEVVAIKPSKEPPQGGTTAGEQVHLVVTAKLLIQLAYNVPMLADEQVAGGPEWISTEVFDILAKMSPATYASMQNMSRAQRREQQQLMEESLLADRMKLKMHFETRDLPVYALTATKGLKLKPAGNVAPGGATVIVNPGGDSPRAEDLRRGILVRAKGRGFEMIAKGVTMDGLMHVLIPRPELRGRTVVDQTGLKDAYDFTLEWGPESTAAPDLATTGEVEEPTLFAAIEQQLGLKLAPAKGPGEVIVIDHIEKPVFDEAEVIAPSMVARVLPVAFAQANPAPQAISPVALPEMRFDVASIRPSPPDDKMMYPPNGSAENFSARMATVESMIGFAYGIPTMLGMSVDPAHFFLPHSPNLIGGPGWVTSDQYDLTARADAETVAAWSKLPKKEQQEELRSMMRALLEERFHLTMRHETREMPAWALVAAKGGPKFGDSAGPPPDENDGSDPAKPYDSSKPYQGRWRLGAGRIQGSDVTIADFAQMLWGQREIESRKIVDQTGLKGKYDLTLRWASVDDPRESDGPSLFTAIQEQLGLKLESTKAPVNVLVIDHIERPSEN